MSSVRGTVLTGLLQELVDQHGEDTEVAVVIDRSRQEITALAVDREVREPDEPALRGAPLIWLISDEPGDGPPPRRASLPGRRAPADSPYAGREPRGRHR